MLWLKSHSLNEYDDDDDILFGISVSVYDKSGFKWSPRGRTSQTRTPPASCSFFFLPTKEL